MTFWAFILALAYLPLPFGFLAWFALARPLAIVVKLDSKSAFKAAYFYSFMANLFQLYWVAVVTPPGMIAAIFIMSLYPAVILLMFKKLYDRKKLIGMSALPFLWVGMEYFRSLTEFAFPWTDLSYSQGYYLTLIQIVSYIGCYGLSFILIVLNLLAWQTISSGNVLEKRVKCGSIFLAILAAVYAFGWAEFPPMVVEGDMRVAVLQGNVDLSTKWKAETRDYNFVLYDSLAMAAAEDSVDLIIWPETAAPCYPRLEKIYGRRLGQTAYNSRAYNLIGGLDVVYYGRDSKTYNSAFQFLPSGQLDNVYHKMKLVPFSEHSPYQDQFPLLSRRFLEKYVRAIRTHDVQWWSDFYPGDSMVIFETEKANYAVLICYESAFPGFVRDAILDGAEFLVNITNDTWFGRSPGPYQHMRFAVFRAIENRVWLARCANSGISALIDPYGREIEKAGLYVQSVISGNIKPLSEKSTFTRIGPIVGQVSFYILILAIIYLLGWGLLRRILKH